MRPSPLRHPLAVLRQIAGLTQGQLGQMVKKSPRTIQSIELGKHPVSEQLAYRISEETGVSFAWIKDGNPHVEPWVHGPAKVTYTKEHFERTRAHIGKGGNPSFVDIVGNEKAKEVLGETAWNEYQIHQDEAQVNWSAELPTPLRCILAALAAADKVGRYELALYRIQLFTRSMSREFGQAITEESLERAAALFDTCRRETKVIKGVIGAEGPIFWTPFLHEREWSRGVHATINSPAFANAELFAQDLLEAEIEALEDRSSTEISTKRKTPTLGHKPMTKRKKR